MDRSCGFVAQLRASSLIPDTTLKLRVCLERIVSRLPTTEWTSVGPYSRGSGTLWKGFGCNSHHERVACFASSISTSTAFPVLMRTGTKNDTESCGGDAPSRREAELADIATGLVDVTGWTVLLKNNREVVGVVDEIMHIGSAESDEIFESVLKLIYTPKLQDADLSKGISTRNGEDDLEELEILVPLVSDIVRDVDARRRLLYISPPDGLLELARIPRLLRHLAPQLSEFCRQQKNGVKDCLSTANATVDDMRVSIGEAQLSAQTGEIESERVEMFMPTRRQLIASGRHDLVETIMAAGGFLSVAHALQLPSRRRPNGFWDDLRNLDAEIEWFVSGSWIKEVDPQTGETIYRNRATEWISKQRPTPGSVANPIPVSQSGSDEGTAVMPRQRNVLEAGRYDLHHAIVAHGGYKVVAQVLGRQPPSKNTSSHFVSKMKTFMEEQAFTHLPSWSELKAHGRGDLVHLLRRHGGLNGLAEAVNTRPKRYGITLTLCGPSECQKGQWSQIEVAANAIRCYLCEKLMRERNSEADMAVKKSDVENKVWNDALRAGSLEMPSQTTLLRDNRADLRYLLQKFGRRSLSDYLGIPSERAPQRHTSPMILTSMRKEWPVLCERFWVLSAELVHLARQSM